MTIKKLIKRSLRTILTLILILGLAIGILLNFIFTPEKITPKALAIANEYLVGEVACERIELTFFSSFPNFGLTFSDGALLPDPSYPDQDTLVQFKEANLSFNLYKFLKQNEVDIKNIQLEKPQLYFHLDSLGGSNWNILKQTDTLEKTQDSTSNFKLNDVRIRKFEINHAKARYKDELSQLTHAINDFNLVLKMVKTDKGLGLDVKNFNREIAIYKTPEKQYKIDKTGVNAELYLSFADTILHVNTSDFAMNDIHFQNKGSIAFFPHQKRSLIHLESKLSTNSLKNFLELVPSRFLAKQAISTSENLKMHLSTNGYYDKEHYPKVAAKISLNDASIAYKDFPGKIDQLNTEITTAFDWDEPENAFAKIEKLDIVGTGIDVHTTANIQQLLANPQCKVQLDGDIDLTKLYQNFPVDKNITASGEIHTHVTTNFLLSELQENHYEKIDLQGEVSLKKMFLASAKDSISLHSEKLNAQFYKQTDTYHTLATKIELLDSDVHFKKLVEASAEKLTGKVWVKQTGERQARLNGDIDLEKFKFQAKESISGFIQNAEVKAQVFPKEENRNTYITSQFTIDSVAVSQQKTFVAIQQGNYDIELTRNAPKKWSPKGSVSFKNLMAYDPKFVHRLKMPASKIEFEKDNFNLDHAEVEFGDSQVELTGKLDHARGFKNGELVTANLNLQSSHLNANQLMQVFASEAEATETSERVAISAQDSLPQEKHTFKIPKNLAFQLHTNIEALEFGKMQLRDIWGKVNVQNGDLQLDHLHLKTLAANLDASLTYTANDSQKANLDFQFYLTAIEMGKLGEFLPVLDSLVPSAHAFEGKADFRIKGKVDLTKTLDFNLKTLRGVAAMKAKDIMVLDGPTFRELAKTFMFKSKEKNPVKNLELEMEFEEDDVKILPALLEIDRYRLALGGKQYFDKSYEYHISVLKSPVPFKTGVDVSGQDFDNYDISVARAKYKYYFTDKERLLKKADSSIINDKARILAELDYQ